MPSEKLQGGCLCGAVRYEVSGDPILVAQCHCTDCRKAASSAHVEFAAFPKEAVRITGVLKTFSTKADSGMMSNRSFCPECGSWISGMPESMPHVAAVTLATLDNPEALAPQMRFYDKRRLNWDTVDPALPAFETLPPMPG